MFFFPFWSSKLSFCYHILFREFPLAVLLLATNYLSFPSLEYVLISFSSWRMFSPDIKFAFDSAFLSVLKNVMPGLPWWRSGWESACQCRGHGFKPWSGKIPYAAEQLGPWATTTEPARLEPVLRNKRGHDSERPAHHDEEWPPLATTRESPRTEMKTQHSQK